MSKLEDELYFQIQSIGLPLPEREYRFDPTRRWRADFAWPDKMLLVEAEGGVYSGGRHTRGTGFRKDTEKYNTATILGWRVLRFASPEIKSGDALSMIEVALMNLPEAA